MSLFLGETFFIHGAIPHGNKFWINLFVHRWNTAPRDVRYMPSSDLIDLSLSYVQYKLLVIKYMHAEDIITVKQCPIIPGVLTGLILQIFSGPDNCL